MTHRLTAFASLTALFSIVGCASAPQPKPAPATAAAPVEARAQRVVNPFANPAPMVIAADQHAPDGSRPGFSAAPAYNIFGEPPSTNLPTINQTVTFESTENAYRVSVCEEGADFDPAVSPDGQWVYFASTRHRPTSDLYVKRVDGTAITQLTSDAAQDVMPSVSPDGKRIAFASNRGGSYDIYVMSSTGGQAVQVTSDPGQELHPTWSPDGKTLAFCRTSESSDRWEIWVTDVSRPGNTRFLTYGLFPAWQPNGDAIAFQRSRERGDRYFSIWTVNYRNGESVNPTEVIASAVAACINPTWSPDGQLIAFSTVVSPMSVAASPAPGRVSPSQADLWIVKADGSARANLTTGPSANLSPTWGPGNRVLFVSNRTGHDNLWSVGSEQALVAMGEMPAPSGSRPGATMMGAAPKSMPDSEHQAEPVEAVSSVEGNDQGGGEAEPH